MNYTPKHTHGQTAQANAQTKVRKSICFLTAQARMKKQLLKKLYACLPAGMAFIVTAMMFSLNTNAQIVTIPDVLFKSKLVNNPAINTNGDGEIQVTEAAAYSGVMDVSHAWPGSGIIDLTGIEAFTALTNLNCSGNYLTSLDVSANTALTVLYCGLTQLTSLNVSTNTALTSLDCQQNHLSSLDVSANTALTVLHCGGNQLTSLNVAANTALTYLWCNSNQLSSLDVSANTALTELNCGVNQLTSLDVAANTALAVLYCYTNQLTSLNVQNGNNVNFQSFNAGNNPNLTCIQVDSVAYSNANWSSGTASFSANCGTTSVPDNGNLATVQIFPNPANGYVTINGLEDIHKIDIITWQGQIIKTILVNGNSLLLDVSSMANGIYILKICSSKQAQIESMVVAH